MSKFHSHKNFKVAGLDTNKEQIMKKRRSLSIEEIKENQNGIQTNIRKVDNDNSETLSDNSDNTTNNIQPKKVITQIDIDISQITCSIITNNYNNDKIIAEEVAEQHIKPQKKKRLFSDFNETFIKHRKEITQRISMEKILKEETMDKHPNLLQIKHKEYTKSTFYILKKQIFKINS